jgi:hypothetical protein
MRKSQRRLLWLGMSILAALTLSPALQGQASLDSKAAVPVLSDWTQHHIIFSKPATAEQAQRVERDPRYRQQQYRQSLPTVWEPESVGAITPEVRYSSELATSYARHRIRKNPGINKDWSEDLGSLATLGATNYPAKISFRGTTATCAGGAGQPDIVVYPTGLLGSGSQASIVAFDNLYSGCTGSGTVPTVYWAYNTGGTVTTSPVFSADGMQVAFVQTDGAGNGVLVLLKYAALSGTLSGPVTVPQVRNSHYPTCTAPCMTLVLFEDASGAQHPDTNSSVFYDYSGDTAYVGDDAGWLHQINPVFNGVPAEVGSAGWPVQVNPTSPTALNSPVHDYASGNEFVTDNGGFLYLVDPTAAVTQSGQLDFSSANDSGPGIVMGPIVDSTAGLVYVFAASDGSGGCAGASDCTAVYQLTTSFLATDTGSEAVVGASTVEPTPPSPLYIGAFDSTYEDSVNATGNLYVCGNTGGTPILYQVPIVAGAMNGVGNPGPALSTSTTPCSPVTDILNPNASGGATEWAFASAETGGVSSGCSAGGCIFNFEDTPWLPMHGYTVGQEVLDSHFQIQVVSVAGTSGAAAPAWSAIIGHSTTDGTVHWLDQGVQSAVTLAAWAASHAYTLHSKILDNNKNVEFVTKAGTSGALMPTFNGAAGGTTTDGTVTWTNLGVIATADMAAAGGTSGIIVDNTVGSGTLAGTSQIYFSTLSDQTCGTSGTGGCAVQASQSALQ